MTPPPPLQADNLHAVSRGQFIWMFNQMAWRSVKSNGGFSGCGILSLQLVSNVCQFCQLLCHVLALGEEGGSGGGCLTEMGSMREPDDWEVSFLPTDGRGEVGWVGGVPGDEFQKWVRWGDDEF